MPKMKTHKGAAKRFKKTGSGKIMQCQAMSSHLFTGRSPKSKRQRRAVAAMAAGDVKRIKQMITYL